MAFNVVHTFLHPFLQRIIKLAVDVFKMTTIARSTGCLANRSNPRGIKRVVIPLARDQATWLES